MSGGCWRLRDTLLPELIPSRNQLSLRLVSPQPGNGRTAPCLAFWIDGRSLIDLVRAVERPFAEKEGHPDLAGRYEWPTVSLACEALLRLAEEDDRKRPLLVCECGEPGCWPLLADVRLTPAHVVWSQFEQPHRDEESGAGQWRYEGLGPFVFLRRDCDQGLSEAVQDADRQITPGLSPAGFSPVVPASGQADGFQPTDLFFDAAMAFCVWAESDPVTPEKEVGTAIELLSQLLALVHELPDGEVGADPPGPGHDGWLAVYGRCAALPFQHYSTCADPHESAGACIETGDLADDLADVWRDLKSGLAQYLNGSPAAAAWTWRSDYSAHWGRHATGALHALQNWEGS